MVRSVSRTPLPPQRDIDDARIFYWERFKMHFEPKGADGWANGPRPHSASKRLFDDSLKPHLLGQKDVLCEYKS